MNDPIVITRSLVKRGWSDIEPKLAAGLVSGTIASNVVAIAHEYGIVIPEGLANNVGVLVFFLIGYILPSAGTTITKTVPSTGDIIEEKHTGPSVSTVTSSIPIQTAPETPAPQAQVTQPAAQTSGARFLEARGTNTPATNVTGSVPDSSMAPTAIIPPPSETQRWRPSTSTGEQH